MKRIMTILVLALCACAGRLIGNEAKVISGSIKPRTYDKTAAFELKQGDRIEVTAQGPQELSIDIYVYAESTRNLAAKSDDDATELFSWKAPQDGRYYVMLRNSSEVAGDYEIRVTPREGSRSIVNPALPNTAAIKVFYATDRVMVRQRTPKGSLYGSEPVEDLQFGVCSVSIPRSHEMGELEGPSIWRLEFSEEASKHIVLLRAQPEDAAAFFHKVSERVGQSTEKEALVFVHGFNTDFESAARRTAQIAYDLGFEGAAVLYSWPSQGKIGLVDYNKDSRNAELSVPRFNEFLSQLASQTGVRRIHVIAHSMGNRVAVHALAASRPANSPRIQQLALLAPDIDAQEFRRLSIALKSSADHVTLYASSRDEALKISESLAGYPRAGEGAPNIVVIPGIDTVDASAVDTSMLGFLHSYFADNQTILSDLFYLIRGNLPTNRVRLQMRQTASGNYWAFVPAVR